MDNALLVVVIALVGWFVVHRLSMQRERRSRHASACNAFRSKIISAVSRVPQADKHWGSEILEDMPKIVIEMGEAVSLFKLSLTKKRRNKLDSEWLDIKSHIETQVPKALSAAEVLYGGGSAMAKDAKVTFHEKIQNLLNFANET